MASYGTSRAVQDALARRRRDSARAQSRDKWFIQQVREAANLTLGQRVVLATEYLKNKVIRNLSVPVGRGRGGRVTERSQPGEFPRADTTLLMKTIFTDYAGSPSEGADTEWVEGYVGTPLDYGLILETEMDRSFLQRTLYEEADRLQEIFESGTVDPGQANVVEV
jgi:hypothetical protein